jgi:uncharacterized membrane protein
MPNIFLQLGRWHLLIKSNSIENRLSDEMFLAMFPFYIILVLVFSVFLRFTNLDQLVYWGDEVYSSLRIFGYTTAQLDQTIAQGNVVAATVLQKFQHLAPDLNIDATVRSLIQEDAHLTPLYFVLVRVWVGLFGDSVGSIRRFSVCVSILVLPSLYWLATELFGRKTRIPWFVLLLSAVSPLQLIFAQEARMYELWLWITIISAASLLRALRLRTQLSWGIFTISTIVSLYVNLLAAIPLLGFLIYTLVLYGRDRPVRRSMLVSTGIVVLAIAPWIGIFVARDAVKTADGTEGLQISGLAALQNSANLVRRIFLDFNTSFNSSVPWAIVISLTSILAFAGIIYALHRLKQETAPRVWLFIGLLVLGLPIALLPQVGTGSLPSRYLLPSYLGVQLAVGYLLGTRFKVSFWRSFTVAIVILGLGSCGFIVRAEAWWHKGFSECNPAIARLTNQRPHPLIITDGTGAPHFDHAISNALSLSLSVKPTTQFQIVLEPELPDLKLDADQHDRYFLTPSEHLRHAIEQKFPGRLKPVMTMKHMYRGTKVCLWHLD